MINHTTLITCQRCGKLKGKEDFSKWYAQDSMSIRYCDNCIGNTFIYSTIKAERAARKAAEDKRLTPVQKCFAKSDYAKNHRKVKSRLEEIQFANELVALGEK